MSLHANISDTPVYQRSPWPFEEGALNCHRQTETQTDWHGHSITESGQWGRFSEKSLFKTSLFEKICITLRENIWFLDCSIILWSPYKKTFLKPSLVTYLSFKFMLVYCCIENRNLKGILKCMHSRKIHVMIFSKCDPFFCLNIFRKEAYNQTNVTNSTLYSRRTHWLL